MVPCPSCSRQSGDERHRCIYCGTALVDDAAVARERALALLPPRSRGRRGFAVAILPGQEAAANVDAVASIFGCEAFMATQMLRRPVPVLIPCPRHEDARALQREIRSAHLDYVVLDYAQMDTVADAALIRAVRVRPTALGLTAVEGELFELSFADVECVIAGRVEIDSSKETHETRFRLDRESDLHRFDTTTETPGHDAFAVFDLYGAGSLRARLLESVCTIEGDGYAKASRGAGFARFARWLAASNADLHVDETYLQLGKLDRRSEFAASGRVLSHGTFRNKEVVGTEKEYSGQDFDDYSVTARTVWRLAKELR